MNKFVTLFFLVLPCSALATPVLPTDGAIHPSLLFADNRRGDLVHFLPAEATLVENSGQPAFNMVYSGISRPAAPKDQFSYISMVMQLSLSTEQKAALDNLALKNVKAALFSVQSSSYKIYFNGNGSRKIVAEGMAGLPEMEFSATFLLDGPMTREFLNALDAGRVPVTFEYCGTVEFVSGARELCVQGEASSVLAHRSQLIIDSDR